MKRLSVVSPAGKVVCVQAAVVTSSKDSMLYGQIF